jgi:hypothetical protein
MVIGIATILMLALLIVASPGWAAPLPQWRSVITYPEPGMTVGGIVEIRGIATHANLDSYQVRYATGTKVVADTAWVDIVMLVPNPVDNGVLCTWDTTTLPDGPYVLALAVWGVDDPGNPHLHYVEHVIIDNTLLPTTEPTPEQLPTVAAGPTQTPVSIAQPATPTPRPSPTPMPEGQEVTPTPTVEETGAGFSLNTPVLRDAFCTGGLITAMLFLLWGLYVLAKASIRWYMRDTTRPPGD